MPEHLRELFDRALDDEPLFPDGDFAQQTMAQGRGIRRRRRGLVIGGSVAAAVVAVVAVSFIPALNHAPAFNPAATPAGLAAQAPAATLALIAQAEPQCTLPAPGDPTDVWISLRPDITDPQRSALAGSLGSDALVREMTYDSPEQAYERFKDLWRDSPEFVEAIDETSLPSSFRLKLVEPARFSEFVAKYAERTGVEYISGGVCR
ncbi:hypothetical protein FB565_005290 [Actinoplanes lutulentus]|uniref:FtsX extracellular domain-containing protein n=1 Tax=Actinoplanes lutulentus TaxID=1287878 RepID=A0A327ZNB2_9ACTN|nr:permease-like cell division protein FtsX [Actinoplanes lutulentus]MBB2945557.1 hypothetical protein [Actinoplanes lutulentus]RAK40311.1 hypothetical protein B0I29_103343 [Actinoplanes lutulentus]